MEKSSQIYQKFRKFKYFLEKSPRLRLGLRHLCYHKLKHRLLDLLNRICSSGFDIETTSHFLLYCQNFINERSLDLNNISGLTKEILSFCDTSDIKLFLYGDDSLDLETSTLILNASVDFISSSKRFDCPFYFIYIYIYIHRYRYRYSTNMYILYIYIHICIYIYILYI